MNSTALMLLLGLMGTVWSAPVCDPEMKHDCRDECDPNMKRECTDGCTLTSGHQTPDFKQMPDLQYSSVAPWDLMVNTDLNREPQNIDYAHCKDCTVEGVEGMKGMPIFLQVSVYERICNNGTCVAWCKCPFELAVGCTCVKQQ